MVPKVSLVIPKSRLRLLRNIRGRDTNSTVFVDLVSENWNQLGSWVFEASEAIVGV
jgi:hypothetical protein